MRQGKRYFRKSSIMFAVLLLLLALSVSGAFAVGAEKQPVRVLVNGQEVPFPDARPFIDEKGRVQAPARFVAQALGAEVAWNGKTSTAYLNGHGQAIALYAGKDMAMVNGQAVSLDSGAAIRQNRLYVPVRFVAEALGASVKWEAGSGIAAITMDLPIIRNFGISHVKKEEGWYTLPRTFTAWVYAEKAAKVDFYLTPTGTGQEPVKIATSISGDEHFSITYELPRGGVMAHFWAVALNDRGEQSTGILNVYREDEPGPPAALYGVPLHPGFYWSEETDPKVREAWLGPGYGAGGGQVIISSRLHSPSSREVADWYKKALSDAGWQGAGPAGGGSRWSLAAEKEGRTLSADYDCNSVSGEGEPTPDPAEGCRIVIVIKDQKVKQEVENIFTPVPEYDLRAEEKSFIEKARMAKGVHRLGDLYVVARGEQPNPGYGLKLVKSEKDSDGATVYIRFTEPEPDMMYAAVITYPYLAGRVKLQENMPVFFVNADTGERL